MAACGFLKEHGYEILEKNYKCKLGEIDVIARRHGRLAFVEIKTRTSIQFGTPQEAVNPQKQKKIFKVAQWHIKEKRLVENPGCIRCCHDSLERGTDARDTPNRRRF
jgi:putative endonuclease